MWRDLTINLADFLFSVADAMDLSDASLVDHQIRTAFISAEIARAAKLDYPQTERLFVAALLHDIGALSPEEKIGLHTYEDLRPEPHCLRGGKLFREAFWLAPSAQIIDWHHTPMVQHQRANRPLSEPNVLAAQILYLADHLERAIRRDVFILHQKESLVRRMSECAGTTIHPEVIALFRDVSGNSGFWLDLVAKDLGRQLRSRNLLRSIEHDYNAARSIALVFKDMTDFRSRFTATHSSGVSCCARGIAGTLGFSGKDLQQIDLAGLLHDVGKMVVPNSILCKPSTLTPEEYTIIQQHPYYTHRVLGRVRGFEQIAEWAAFHHERLDGSGYCNSLGRSKLDIGAKVIAVADVATAIAERRPYRDPGGQSKVMMALREMQQKELIEGIIVEALADNYQTIMEEVEVTQQKDETRYTERYAMIV